MKKTVKLFMFGLLGFCLIGISGCSREDVKIENVATDYDKKIKEEMETSEIKLVDFYHTTADKIVFYEENKSDDPATVIVLSLNNANSWAKDLLKPKVKVGEYNDHATAMGYAINENQSLLFLAIDEKLDISDKLDLELSIDNEQEDGIITINKEVSTEKVTLETKNDLVTIGEIAKLSDNTYAMKINSALNTDTSDKKESTKILNLFVWGSDFSINNKDIKLIDKNGNDITQELNASFDIMKIYNNFCGIMDKDKKGLFGRIQITTTFKTDKLSNKELNDFLLRINDSSLEIQGNKFSFKDGKQNYN